MNNEFGFSFSEVMISSFLALLIISTLLPVFILIEKERMHLNNKIKVVEELFNLSFVKDDELLLNSEKMMKRNIDGLDVTIRVKSVESTRKICASWKNDRKRKENLCLYGKNNQK